MLPHYTISERCPGCGVRLTHGMDGLIEVDEGSTVVYPHSPQSDAHTCDAIYIGFHCLWDKPTFVPCPRCGCDVGIKIEPRQVTRLDGDDRDFMEIHVSDLELSVRARAAMVKVGVRVARDLLSLSASDIQRQLPPESWTVVEEVRQFLADRSLALRGEQK